MQLILFTYTQNVFYIYAIDVHIKCMVHEHTPEYDYVDGEFFIFNI